MIGKARRILPVWPADAATSVGASSQEIFELGGIYHLVCQEDFVGSPTPTLQPLYLDAAQIEPSTEVFSFGCSAHLQNYGAPGSCLVDMKGIRNLIFAKALQFSDDTIRRLLVACGALSPSDAYLYVGLGGAAPEGTDGAGEYLQFSILSGRRGGGFGWGLKGHVLGESVYGTTSLLGEGTSVLPDDRFAYSQMALLRRGDGEGNFSWGFRIESRKSGASVLDALIEAIDRLSIQACALTVLVSGKQPAPIVIIGRVTKGKSAVPWHKIQHATDSALEQTFLLGPDQFLLGFGNRLRRQEPDWHRLTGGREYQARGHIHATLSGVSPGWPQHTTFHLKDILLPAGAVAFVGIAPVERAFRIFPLTTQGGRLVCEATGRTIELLHG